MTIANAGTATIWRRLNVKRTTALVLALLLAVLPGAEALAAGNQSTAVTPATSANSASSAGQAAGTAAPTPLVALASAERLFYGKELTGSLVERINSLERDVFGDVQTGALFSRIDRLQAYLLINSAGVASVATKLNALEWFFARQLSKGSIVPRLQNLETLLYGSPRPGSAIQRINDLVALTWPGGKLDVADVKLADKSLVRIKLLDEVNSAANKVGDTIRYVVTDDVTVGGRVVIPAGSPGEGVVAEVTSAGRFGRDGRVVIDFRSVSGIDGVPIPVRVDLIATEQNKSLQLAAGASMAGVILLGPIGIVGAYFVAGKEHVIPVGTEFFIETQREMVVSGLKVK